MSKKDFDAEIQRAIEKAMDGIREEMSLRYIHDITLYTPDLVDGLQNACDSLQDMIGLTSKQKAYINSHYNNNSEWTDAVATVINKITSNLSTIVKGGHTLTKVGDVHKYGNFRGMYVIEQTRDKLVLRLYNKQAGSPSGSRRFETVNKQLRQKFWDAWWDKVKADSKTTSHADGPINMNRGAMYRKNKGTGIKRGSELPFAHETTVGMEAMDQLGEALDLNQTFDSYEGIFATDQSTLDLWQQVTDALNVEWEEEEVVNVNTGKIETVRIVKGSLIPRPRNLPTSNVNDWINIRNDLQDKIKNFLSKAKPVNGISAVGFEASKPFKKKARQVAGEKLIKDILKKNKGKAKRTKKRNADIKTGKTKRSSVVKKAKVRGAVKKHAKKRITVLKRPTKSKERGTGRQASTNQAKELARLKKYINSRLPAEVRRNHGKDGAIRKRTGRFSNSVEIRSMTQAQNSVMIKYTYLLSPYETFENTGRRRWPMSYNPKLLIAKSIRNLAEGRINQKLTLRRV